jgi:hypothetical protein
MRKITMINRPDKCVHTQWATKAYILCFGANAEQKKEQMINVCDKCGETVTDLDAGFSPAIHEMRHECGGTWRRPTDSTEERTMRVETRLLVYARHLEDALDECVDWIAENAPGLLANDSVKEMYDEAIAEGKSEEEAIEYAEQDTTQAGNCGDYILSYEWGIVGEGLSPKEIANYVHER